MQDERRPIGLKGPLPLTALHYYSGTTSRLWDWPTSNKLNWAVNPAETDSTCGDMTASGGSSDRSKIGQRLCDREERRMAGG